jgi:hypothetical protein
MALSITGGQQLITSDMQRTFRDATAQAKKQLEETGSLQGFSKEFTSSSAEGTVTIEISAIASAFYEKSADGDDYFLAYKVTDKPYYSDGGVGVSSGSSTTIADGEGIEAFTSQALGIMSNMHWGTLIDGSPEEIEAYLAAQDAERRAQPGFVELQPSGSSAAAAVANAAGDTPRPTEPNSKLAKAQVQSESANQLVAKLSDFLQGLKGQSNEAPNRAEKSTEDGKPVQTALSQLLARVNLTT